MTRSLAPPSPGGATLGEQTTNTQLTKAFDKGEATVVLDMVEFCRPAMSLMVRHVKRLIGMRTHVSQIPAAHAANMDYPQQIPEPPRIRPWALGHRTPMHGTRALLHGALCRSSVASASSGRAGAGERVLHTRWRAPRVWIAQ